MSDTRFDPSLPHPYNENWKMAYRINKDDAPRLSTYQAPDKNPIPFILENIRLGTGQSVDTAEYPFWGLWSNTPLNEKPQTISIRGFIRGPEYIKNRNALVEALRIKTSDETPGFLDLPLWGRFSVVVNDTSIEEDAAKNGQCAVSINFTRAGVTEQNRWDYVDDGFDYYKRTEAAAAALQKAAVASFEANMKLNGDSDFLADGFNRLKNLMLGVVGRIQGAQSFLNNMTNEVVNISNIIAQGIRSPKELAEALFSAAAGIAAGVMDIKNSWDETTDFLTTGGNLTNFMMQFLSQDKFTLDTEAVTVKQIATKTATENLYRTVAYCAVSPAMVQLDGETYQRVGNYWKLFDQLENSIDQNDPAIYQAIQDMRIAVSQELAAKRLDLEMRKNFRHPLPLLTMAHHLGTSDREIRRLNIISDSFVIKGDVNYV